LAQEPSPAISSQAKSSCRQAVMSHTQLTGASDEEMPDLAPPKPRTSRWRGLGLAVMAVGLVCVVGANWPRKRVTPRQRFGQMRDAMMQAFSKRSLQEASSLTTRLEFALGEDGAEEPSAMMIDANFISDEDVPPKQFSFEVTFNANEGAGADLKAAFDQVLEAAQMKDMITLTQDEDSVLVSVTVPEDEIPDEEEGEITEVFQKHPELNANFKFGRDLDTMYENMKDNVVVGWSGLHFAVDMKFKGILIDALKDSMRNPYESQEAQEEQARWLEAFTLFAGKLEFRYKKVDELGDMFDKLPPCSLFYDQMMEGASTMPDDVKPLFKNIKASINGLKKVEIRGLPEKMKISIGFTNFKPVKLFGKMVDEVA